MFEVKVRIEAPEVAQAIRELAAAINGNAAAMHEATQQVRAENELPPAEKPAKKGKTQPAKPEPQDDTTQGAAAEDKPAEPAPTQVDKPADQQEITIEVVRAKLAELSRNGKQQQVKELLGEFGATKLSAIDPKDYPKLMELAEALG